MSVTLDASTMGSSSGALALLQAVLALGVVCAVAFVVLRLLARRGFGTAKGRALQVEERLALDLKNAVWIVRVDQRRVLLSTSDHGPARLLLELSGQSLEHTPKEGAP